MPNVQRVTEHSRNPSRLKKLVALMGGLAMAGAITGYNLIGGPDIGNIELLLTIPAAIGGAALVYFMIRES